MHDPIPTSAATLTSAERTPKITVGIPVYNGERTLQAALDTLLEQSFTDFLILISDNGSTDTTAEICLRYAERDTRIQYIRQPINLGAEKNFRFLLEQAQSEYFMWASADDHRSADFIAVNLAFLEANPDYIASISPCRFEDGEFNSIAMGDFSLTTPLEQRIKDYFTGWHANGRYCSLFRRQALMVCPAFEKPFLGCDWAIVLSSVTQGKTNRHADGWVIFGAQGISKQQNIFRVYRHHWYELFLPFFWLSVFIFKLSKDFSVRTRLQLLEIVLRLNFNAVKIQLERKSRRIGN